MLRLGWVFICFVAGKQTSGFDHSACATKRVLWTYPVKGAEDFVLFCDLPELRKPQVSLISQLSPAQGSAHTRCSGDQDLSDVQWYVQPPSGGPLEEIGRHSPYVQTKGMLHILTPPMNNAGSYICRPRIRSPQDMACCIKTVLELKPERNVSCGKPAGYKQYLFLGSTGSIYCPGLSCQSDAQSPKMTWYQDGRLLPEYKNSIIKLAAVYDYHQGLYVCDYTQSDNSSSWTVRAVVQVRTIVKDINLKPDILDPITDTLEVELGKSLTLSCKVQFGFQRDFQPVIKWYVKESTQEWEFKVFEEKCIQSNYKNKVIEHTIFLREVTQRDLSRKFVCFAQNSIGNTTRTIQLRQKEGVVFVYILLGTALMLVAILTAAAFLYWYWIEIVLLCRAYQSKDETLMDKKEFDAFVSYANRSCPESGATGSLSEGHLALSLFPEVLENKYGYTLCLLERDVTPGGVYADDIVDTIKRSRRGIFILSPSYVNGPHVFELQAAVSLALVDQTLKLILIEFCSFQVPESLPYLVRKALRVLPTVTWRGLKSVQPSSRFWTQICYHMPVKNSNRLMCNRLRIIPRGFSPEKDQARQKPPGGTPGSGDGRGARDLLLPTHQKRC
ncbi:interleukin-18 receptor accessory protein [Phodopus roborovskii]|uniref:Interleukin-18 receptor accessory protein n=1 Tax=Phodopus roborovskii TaxID=109678 RepID=A0AAV0A6A7_PHORO|nr:interleukin-18 receptor accessory protein [Phodopus roborovskii]CAH7233604.1 Il18rap [Phodopus roborovskii]